MSNKAEIIKKNSNLLRGTLKESLENPITGALADDDQIVIKFHGIYQQDDRDRREERAQKKLENLYTFMLRLRIPAGKITAKQWIGIDDIANAHSTKVIKITTRQTVQLHGIIKSQLKPTISWFAQYGLDSIAACGDVNRNVMATTTVETLKAHNEVYEFSKAISDTLLPKTRAYHEIWIDDENISPVEGEGSPQGGAATVRREKITEPEVETIYSDIYLPRKFKIVVAIPPDNDVDVYAHDIGLIAIIEKGELQGYNITVGGGMGSTHGNKETYPRIGNVIGYTPKENAMAFVHEIVRIQRDLGNREDRKLSRFKYTVEKYGPDFIRAELEKRVGKKLEKIRDFKFEQRSDYYGWHKDYLGNNHFVLYVENGRVFDDETSKLKTALIEIAKKDLANFRFTANQNIIISDISDKNKKAVEEIFDKYDISNEGISNIAKGAIACVALNTCPLALAEAQRYFPSLLAKVDHILHRHKLQNEQISFRMTGCPNGCARPFLAEVGFVGKSLGIYNMYLGGSNVGERLNYLYKEDLDEKAILYELDGLFGSFVKDKKGQENFGDYTNRLRPQLQIN